MVGILESLKSSVLPIFMPHLDENKLLKLSESNVIGCWMTSMVHLYLEI